jgi:hypothetical protein
LLTVAAAVLVTIYKPNRSINAFLLASDTTVPMSESDDPVESFDQERIEALVNNAEAVLKNKEQIELAIEQALDSELRFNNFDPLLQSVSGPLYGDVENEVRMLVSEALVNIIARYPSDLADHLSKNSEHGDELVDFLNRLEAKFRIKLQRRLNRQYKGNDWWSNIKTDSGFRSGQPIFHHEFTKDYEDRVVITSDAQNTLALSRHFLEQIHAAQGDLGEDVLDYISEDTVDEIVEMAQELAEAVEKYPDSIEIAESKAESVEDSSE